MSVQLATFLIGFMLALWPTTSSTGAEDQGDKPILRVVNWSTYIDVDPAPEAEGNGEDKRPMAECSPTLRAFAAAQNCRIDYIEYDSEAGITPLLIGNEGRVDVACISQDLAVTLREAGLLAPLTSEQVPHLTHILPRYLEHLGQQDLKDVIAPYLAGTTGLVYRRDRFADPVDSWMQYFKPDPALGRSVAVLDEPYSLWGFACQALGLDPNKTDRTNTLAAARLVAGLMRSDQVAYVGADPEEVTAKLVAGELSMAIMYSGDALGAMEMDENLAYVLPKEGSEIWSDVWVVFRQSTQIDRAYAFIDHILEPEIHARLATEMGYQCPSKAALTLIREQDPDYFANEVIFPKESTFARLGSYLQKDPEIDRIWLQLREE